MWPKVSRHDILISIHGSFAPPEFPYAFTYRKPENIVLDRGDQLVLLGGTCGSAARKRLVYVILSRYRVSDNFIAYVSLTVNLVPSFIPRGNMGSY